MTNVWKDRLASLRRQYREMPLKSIDGESEEVVYYRRPTEMEDDLLQKSMKSEFEAIKATLKESSGKQQSVYEELKEHFTAARAESLNYLLLERLPVIRKNALAEAGVEELSDDATDEQKKEWEEKVKPVFERLRDEAKEEIEEAYKETPDEVLATRVAESRIEFLAQERAWAIYRRSLVAQSLYGKDDEGLYVRIFDDAEDVAKNLDKDTIDTLANMIAGEIKKHKNVPLK